MGASWADVSAASVKPKGLFICSSEKPDEGTALIIDDRDMKSATRPSALAVARGAQATSKDTKPRNSFPYAFERWEILSKHWEGLTSFWIRRLEAHATEISGDPLSEQLAGQITDISAAGASLFHTVVELHRLRASSERKFQRWFSETRAEQERFQALQLAIEVALKDEQLSEQVALIAQKTQLEETFESQLSHERAQWEMDMARLQNTIEEQSRTVTDTKDEARRAWEELGRRDQEKRDLWSKMASYKPVMVGGVVLFPLKSSSWDEESENRPLLYEATPAPKVPYPWTAHWDGDCNKWLFRNPETKECGFMRLKPDPGGRPMVKKIDTPGTRKDPVVVEKSLHTGPTLEDYLLQISQTV